MNFLNITIKLLNIPYDFQIQAQYDLELEGQCRRWFSAILGEPFPEDGTFHEVLKDGTLLCRSVINTTLFK